MGLVRIFDPRTASEALVVVAMLEAHEIPAYLRSGHLASVLPGVQIGCYNSQSVLVPEEQPAPSPVVVPERKTPVKVPEEQPA